MGKIKYFLGPLKIKVKTKEFLQTLNDPAYNIIKHSYTLAANKKNYINIIKENYVVSF